MAKNDVLQYGASPPSWISDQIITSRCILVQSAVLRSHVVCLSVTLVDGDHIGWNSSEIISPLVSVGCSLSADPNIRGLLQLEHPEILAQSDPPPYWFERRRHSIANSGRMVRITVNGEPIGNHHRSLEWCHRWPLPPPLPPKMGVLYVLRYANGHISATGDPIHFMFWSMVWFLGSADRMALFPVTSNPIGGRPPSWIIWMAISPQRLIRSTYVARIARSSLR